MTGLKKSRCPRAEWGRLEGGRTGYAGGVITYRRQNALTPEKDAEIRINLTPLLFFLVGFLVVRALLGTAQVEAHR